MYTPRRYDVRQDPRHMYRSLHLLLVSQIRHTVLDGYGLILVSNSLNVLLVHVLGAFQHVNVEQWLHLIHGRIEIIFYL